MSLRPAHTALPSSTLVEAAIRRNPAPAGESSSVHAAHLRDAMNQAARGCLKILVVNPIYGGSLPTARYCASALRRLGHQVEVFESERCADSMGFAGGFRAGAHVDTFRDGITKLLAKGVEMKVREEAPDLVLALAQAPLERENLVRLREWGYPTLFWFVEDYRTLTYWTDVAESYDIFAGIQQEPFRSSIARYGCRNYVYLPCAADPTLHAPLELSDAEREEYGSAVSFVGAGYYNRRRMFPALADLDFKIWGSDWANDPPLNRLIQRNGSRIDTETCIKIFNASAINLNLHSSSTLDSVDPDGDFVNPRTFELAACGAFQLVDRRALLGDLFAEGELAHFADPAEMRDAVLYYLEHADDRGTLAAAARARVLAEHTYEARMTELLAHAFRVVPHLARRQRERLEKVTDAWARLERHPDLYELLSRLEPGCTLQQVWQTIGNSEGALSRAEKIFLMLKNIGVVAK